MNNLLQFAASRVYDPDTGMYRMTNESAAPADQAGALMAMLFLFIFSLLIYIFASYCFMKILQKAKHPQPWAGWVPVYQNWALLQAAGRPGWWALLISFIPFVGLIFWVIGLIDLASSFGKSTGFKVLLVLLPAIGYALLAFGSDTYKGPAGPEKPAYLTGK